MFMFVNLRLEEVVWNLWHYSTSYSASVVDNIHQNSSWEWGSNTSFVYNPSEDGLPLLRYLVVTCTPAVVLVRGKGCHQPLQLVVDHNPSNNRRYMYIWTQRTYGWRYMYMFISIKRLWWEGLASNKLEKVLQNETNILTYRWAAMYWLLFFLHPHNSILTCIPRLKLLNECHC